MWIRTRVHLAKEEDLFFKFKNFLAFPANTTHIICDSLINLESGVYLLGYNDATVVGNVNDSRGAIICSSHISNLRLIVTSVSSIKDLVNFNDYQGILPRAFSGPAPTLLGVEEDSEPGETMISTSFEPKSSEA